MYISVSAKNDLKNIGKILVSCISNLLQSKIKINGAKTQDFQRWKQSVNHMFCAQTQVTWSRPQTPPISLALSVPRLQIQVQEPALPVQIGQSAGGRAAGVDRIPWGRALRPLRLPLAVQILGRTQVWTLAIALLLNIVWCSFSSIFVFNHDGAAASACSRSYWKVDVTAVPSFVRNVLWCQDKDGFIFIVKDKQNTSRFISIWFVERCMQKHLIMWGLPMTVLVLQICLAFSLKSPSVTFFSPKVIMYLKLNLYWLSLDRSIC